MIRKLTLPLLICIALSASAQAQSPEPASPKINIGVKAGANLYDNYQLGAKYFVSAPNAGFHAGVYGDYGLDFLNQDFTARVEALFSTRGLYLSEYIDGQRIDYERESSYADFPVSLNYNILENLRIHAGVVSSLFIEEYRSVTKDAEGFRVEEGDQFRSYERWQFGALAGASYTFSLMDQSFEAGVRYSMAFTRTNELIREVRASRDPRYMMLQVYIAYTLFEL